MSRRTSVARGTTINGPKEPKKEIYASRCAEENARAEAAATEKKYQASTADGAEMNYTRREHFDFMENLNQATLIPGGAGIGKKVTENGILLRELRPELQMLSTVD